MNEKIKISTFNVNSIKARLERVVEYLREDAPDIALLQELKCMDEAFPREAIEELGYNVQTHGQKTYNGVAILSKFPLDDVQRNIPNFEDDQARYIEAVACYDGGAIRVASVYVPNGQEVGSEKFEYKMRFFDALYDHLKTLYEYDELQIIGGDFNVALEEVDVYDAPALEGSVCYHNDERRKMNALLHHGYTDSWRALNPGAQEFSWWDYRAGAFQHNKGLRIDYLLANPQTIDKCERAYMLKDTRAKEKPSDHIPVVVEVKL